MAPRWKGKAAEATALAEPISGLISRLQSLFLDLDSQGMLTGCNVLLSVNLEQAELLNHTCFGRPMITSEPKQWYQLSLEEASYLYHVLKCIKIIDRNMVLKNPEEVWQYMTTMVPDFPIVFKAYAHLRSKNWIVRSGSQYGTDLVAYRHHPSLVHSEFAVLVLSDEAENRNSRLKAWSDYHGALRLCGSVAKTLLALYVERNTKDSSSVPVSCWCLNEYSVDERIISRWNPEQSREDQMLTRKGM